MANKDKGGNKGTKKKAAQTLKEKRQAKKSKSGGSGSSPSASG
ncbi:MAG: hypothetical protein ABI635_10830 [Actinomycetota bacterium]